VLAERVPGQGEEQGRWLLGRLARHPATARHVCRRLARRFVADEPPAPLVERAARRFLETGGEIPAVLETLLRSPELAAPESRKLKTPLELVASAVRATGGQTDGRRLSLASTRLGEAPWLAPSPAGYPDTAERWIDPGAMLERMGVALALTSGRLEGTQLGDAEPEGLATRLPAGARPRERQVLALASPEFQWQ
jgi:uncharacterized protein (DUF1800 family)